MIAICAYFMLNPFPGTDKTLYSELFYPWTNPTSTTLTTGQDLGSVIGNAMGMNIGTTRTVIGVMVAAFMVWFAFKSADFRSSFDNKLAGVVVGLAVIGAWYATGHLVTINADGEMYSWTQYTNPGNWDFLQSSAAARPRDVGVQSFTFINPIGQTLRYAVQEFNPVYVTFGLMAVLGVILGSFTWAVISKGFRIEWFVNFKDFLTHLIGGILMGIGGVLALGCTIGQGITGISTLAMGSFLAFAGIVFGSAMTMKIQYYKMVYEDEASIGKAFVTALVDFKLLPGSMRKLEAI